MVNRLLSEHEARLYEQWIANDRAVCALLVEMRAVVAKVQALILAQEEQPAPEPVRRRRRIDSPETRTPTSQRSD